jgi:hypothetical protein
VRAHSELDTQAVVSGTIGAPQPTMYSFLGPWPIGLGCALLTLAGLGLRGRNRSR